MKQRPYISHALEVRYRDDTTGTPSVETQLRHVFELLNEATGPDPSLHPSRWFIATGDEDSSYLYQAFNTVGPATGAVAFLREANKEEQASQNFVLWNGETERTKGASVNCRFARRDGHASSMTFAMRSEPDEFRLGIAGAATRLMTEAIRIYGPIYSSLSAEQYDPVFPDRPPAGWILYLPLVLTSQQVPEARTLIQVEGKDAKDRDTQIGTIIVSVADAPFSDLDPAHVAVAQAIEVRLVDQDLLPLYKDI